MGWAVPGILCQCGKNLVTKARSALKAMRWNPVRTVWGFLSVVLPRDSAEGAKAPRGEGWHELHTARTDKMHLLSLSYSR